MTNNNKKPRKLPDRYPREREIMVFGDMSELDHVLELLAELGEHLSAVPGNTSDEEWKRACDTPLAHLLVILRKAYVEYERFWQQEGWKLEDDADLNEALSDCGELRWRLEELERGRPVETTRYVITDSGTVKRTTPALSYDPAQLACARALYFSLALMQMPGDKSWVAHCLQSLRFELTRYHAAALEVLLGRSPVFKAGRSEGSQETSTKYIFALAKNDRMATAKELFNKADKKIIGNMTLIVFSNHMTAARKKYPKVKKTSGKSTVT